jgi:PST family polysaccharide transporter
MIELSGKLAALISAVTAAIVLRNYWAIVAGTVTGPFVMMIVSYIIAPMAPG